MGPKKKGKSKGDKKKKAAAVEGANAEPEVPMEERTKEFYMNQIQSLRKKVSSLQEECDSYLVAQHANFERLETLKEIRLGSRAFLSRQMDEINLEIKKLNDQLRELDELKEAESFELNKQIHDLQTKDLQETKEKNENENHILRSKLNSLDELKSRKETLLNEINRLEEQLKQQEHQYQEEIYHKEKFAVLEKDKLRKDMRARVGDLSSEFRRVSKMQVVQTTRQIILENVRLNGQMSTIETTYNDVEAKNGQLREQKKTHALEKSLLEERERMMAKKNRKIQDYIDKLLDTCSSCEQYIVDLDEKLSTFQETQQLIDDLEAMNQKSQERRDQLSDENDLLSRQINQQEQLVIAYDDELERTHRVFNRTLQSLTETIEANSGSSPASRTIDVRVRAFDSILQLLNLATQMGVGPKLNDLTAQKAQTTIIRNQIDEERPLSSPVQPLGALKKLKTRSVAIQTNISNRNPVPYHLDFDPNVLRRQRSPLVST